MNKYLFYELEDFIVDDFFIEWIRSKDPKVEQVWIEWLKEHPEKNSLIELASEVVSSIDILPFQPANESEIKYIVSAIKEKTTHSEQRPFLQEYFQRNYKEIIKYAAIFVISIGLGSLYYKNHWSDNKVGINANLLISKVNNGAFPILVHLSDGTSITLQPKSTLVYPSVFAGKLREVKLIGEAFFEVKHKSDQPFLVHSGEMVTQVLGTSFVVKAYAGSKEFKVLVRTGKVGVYHQTNRFRTNSVKQINTIILTPDQQIVFNRKDGNIVKVSPDTSLLSANKRLTRGFNFSNVPLGDVIQSLKTAYGVKITYSQKNMGNCELTARLSNQPLFDKINAICQALDASFVMRGDTIIINGKGCN
jgi:hypothetical protein